MPRNGRRALLVLLVCGLLGLPAAPEPAGASEGPYFDMGHEFDVEYRGLGHPVRVQLWQRTVPDVRRVRVRISSDSDPVGFLLMLDRDARSSNYFVGSFRFTVGSSRAEGALLRVADGDTFRIQDLTTSSGVRAPDLVEIWHAGAPEIDGRAVVFSDATPGAALVSGAFGAAEPGATVTVLAAEDPTVLARATARADGSFTATFDNSAANHPEVRVSIQESVGSASPPAPVYKAGLVGRVVRSDGRPADGLWVESAWTTTAHAMSALTRPDGAFIVEQRFMRTGSAQARAWSQLPPDQGPSAPVSFAWDGMRTKDVGTLTLTAASLSGRLVDAHGRPVHEAEVESGDHVDIYGNPLRYHAYADADGRFSRWLPDGTYTFTGREPMGCRPMWFDAPATVRIKDGVASPRDPTWVLHGASAPVTVEIPAAPGDDVMVQLPTPVGEVELTFSDVVGGGDAYAGCHATPPLDVGEPTLDDVLDLTVEGPEFGDVEICAPYDPAAVLAAGFTEDRLTLLQADKRGAVEDITTRIDAAADRVCGTSDVLAMYFVGSEDRGTLRIDRWSGQGRAETAARISAATTLPGADVAYVATGENFPDALAAGPVAANAEAPILLTGRDAIPEATRVELMRLRPARIVVLGGRSAVGSDVEASLRHLAATGNVERLAGSTRFDTAVAVSRRHMAPGVEAVYLATGATFPDALAAGSAAAHHRGPVLLVQRDELPAVVAAELQRLQPRQVVVAGGPAAVSESVMVAAGQAADAPARRVSGPDRFSTASLLAEELPTEGVSTAFLATGRNFPDALTGVAAAGRIGAPLLLAVHDHLPQPTQVELLRRRPHRVVLLGGPSVLDEGHEPAIRSLLDAAR